MDDNDPRWQRNIWTGTDKLDVTKNGRIVRQGFYNPRRFLYHAEFWGDYSHAFPVHGEWRKSLSQAKRDLAALAKKHTS